MFEEISLRPKLEIGFEDRTRVKIFFKPNRARTESIANQSLELNTNHKVLGYY